MMKRESVYNVLSYPRNKMYGAIKIQLFVCYTHCTTTFIATSLTQGKHTVRYWSSVQRLFKLHPPISHSFRLMRQPYISSCPHLKIQDSTVKNLERIADGWLWIIMSAMNNTATICCESNKSAGVDWMGWGNTSHPCLHHVEPLDSGYRASSCQEHTSDTTAKTCNVTSPLFLPQVTAGTSLNTQPIRLMNFPIAVSTYWMISYHFGDFRLLK